MISTRRNLGSLVQRLVDARLKRSRLGNPIEQQKLNEVVERFVANDELHNVPKLIQCVLNEVYGVEITIQQATYLLLEAVILHE